MQLDTTMSSELNYMLDLKYTLFLWWKTQKNKEQDKRLVIINSEKDVFHKGR